MKGKAMVFLTLAAAVLAPTPILAQDSGMNRTLSPDSILARFEKGVATTAGAPGARDHAIAFLCRNGNASLRSGRLEPQSRTELDAFANRLVDIAVAHPSTGVASDIRIALRVAGNPEPHPGEVCVPYDGAWDALQRIHDQGAGTLDDLIDIDIQRGIEYGLARLAELEGVELCSFLRRVVQSGELGLLADGTLGFEVVPSVDYRWGIEEVLAEELLVEGFIRDTGPPWSPCSTRLHGVITVVGEEPPSPREIMEDDRGFYLVGGDTVRVLKRRGKGGE